MTIIFIFLLLYSIPKLKKLTIGLCLLDFGLEFSLNEELVEFKVDFSLSNSQKGYYSISPQEILLSGFFSNNFFKTSINSWIILSSLIIL